MRLRVAWRIWYYSLLDGCSLDGCSLDGCSLDAFSSDECSIADFSPFLLQPTKPRETTEVIATGISNFFKMFIVIYFLSLLSVMILIVLIQHHTVQSYQSILWISNNSSNNQYTISMDTVNHNQIYPPYHKQKIPLLGEAWCCEKDRIISTVPSFWSAWTPLPESYIGIIRRARANQHY